MFGWTRLDVVAELVIAVFACRREARAWDGVRCCTTPIGPQKRSLRVPIGVRAEGAPRFAEQVVAFGTLTAYPGRDDRSPASRAAGGAHLGAGAVSRYGAHALLRPFRGSSGTVWERSGRVMTAIQGAVDPRVGLDG